MQAKRFELLKLYANIVVIRGSPITALTRLAYACVKNIFIIEHNIHYAIYVGEEI